MRIAIDEDGTTKGFEDAMERYGINLFFLEIRLDGAVVSGATMADDEAGEVRAYLIGANGKFVEDTARERIVTETRRGVVQIILKPTSCGEWPHRVPRPGEGKPPIDFSFMRF